MSPRPPRGLVVAAGSLCVAAACASRTPAPWQAGPAPVAVDESAVALPVPGKPVLPPQAAMLLGLLPRRVTGAEQFLAANAEFDGRGVLIAILDSGIDAGLPGLRRTTTGDRKLADLRDFSGEGRIALTPITADGDAVTVEGRRLGGFGRVVRLALPPYYGGTLDEASLGAPPAADVNGDGDARDRLPLVVARASDGWFVMADTDGDGSLTDEVPIRDYATAAETFAFGPLTLAANFGSVAARPTLDLFFDTSGHGSHVAGIAAGHDLFGVAGFDGIAPGAQLLGLKIANNARGGVSVTGSMVRAIAYAADYAARGGMPLVLNLSYGVGNDAAAGRALIDSVLDAYAVEHPGVTIVISAGNDGPGISTIGFPGSADFALSACALFPGVFAKPPQAGGRSPDDVLGWWSSRGGSVQKPDLCVPGVAFSNVPPWDEGEEVAGGTSMAAPQLSGAAALLQSAAIAGGGRPASSADVTAALKATARPIPGATTLDEGAGVPNVAAAWRWLKAGHRGGRFAVRALHSGTDTPWATAAYRRDGLASTGDTVQRFSIAPVGSPPAPRLLLRSDAPWLHTPDAIDLGPGPVTVQLTYAAAALQVPGLYVGTVWARPASDTLGGAVLGLTNAVVVPYTLDQPFTARQHLKAGQMARFFFRVPSGAGGLSVEARIADPDQRASLFLFEPSGRPLVESPSAEVGGELGDTARLTVRQDDLLAGVYEAVAIAPPNEATTVELAAALAPVRVAAAPDGVTLANTSADPASASVRARLIGTAKREVVAGRGTVRRTVPLRVPEWAVRLMVDVRVDHAVWSHITDFAVSLWDSAGALVAEMPLDHSAGRHYVSLDSLTPRRIELELLPAFTFPHDTTPWSATVTVAFLREDPLPFAEADVTMPAHTTVPVAWHMPASAGAEGFDPFVEILLRADDRPTTAYRVILPSSTMSAGDTR